MRTERGNSHRPWTEREGHGTQALGGAAGEVGYLSGNKGEVRRETHESQGERLLNSGLRHKKPLVDEALT